jgi:methylmalonyl-CoA mutase C-terminal domain/subunit
LRRGRERDDDLPPLDDGRSHARDRIRPSRTGKAQARTAAQNRRRVATDAAFAGRLSPVKRKLRILVAKAGLDGHDRGAKVVARALADAGYEVIYSGLHQTAEMIAAAAQQESVDAVGLSMMSGAHMTQFPAILDALKARGAHDVVVFGGGIVPDEDADALKALGVAAIFTPGTSTQAIVDWIERELRPRVEGAAA